MLILVYSDNFVTLFKGVGTYFEPVNKFCGACSGAVEALCYKPEGHRFDS